jgi:uncharacterized membrane protein
VNPGDVDPNLPPGLNRRLGERRRRRATFSDDFRRFFLRGLSALLPTIITLWLLIWVWGFLWENLGRHMISAIVWVWNVLVEHELMPFRPAVYTRWFWWNAMPEWLVQLIGVAMAVSLIYLVGLLVGNLIGRTIWRLAEMAVMRIPLVRAVYPAVKQVTDFVLAERSSQFEASQVVAVRPHADGIWSIGLVTGPGLRSLSDAVGGEMVTVFIPSTPTAFSGYVRVVPRDAVVELPLKVEEAMRLLVSGGVITPGTVPAPGPAGQRPAIPASPPAEPANPGSAPDLLPGPARGREPAAARLAND